MAVINIKDLSTYKAEQVNHDDINKKAKRHKRLDPSEWPILDFKWDLNFDAQRFALDGYKIENFQKDFPRGFCLGWVLLQELDDKLCKHNRRERHELWKVGNPDKLARAIEYICRNNLITPPLVAPIPEQNLVCLKGGNHRYTVAKFSYQKCLPIYIEPENCESINSILNIYWDLKNYRSDY